MVLDMLLRLWSVERRVGRNRTVTHDLPWIDAHGTQIDSSVLYPGIGAPDQHGKPDDADDADHVAKTTLLCSVRNKADGDGGYCSQGVWWDRKQVGSGARIAKAGNDGGREEREGVKSAVTACSQDLSAMNARRLVQRSRLPTDPCI